MSGIGDDDQALVNLLAEIKYQLQHGPATPTMQSMIAEMLSTGRVYDDPCMGAVSVGGASTTAETKSAPPSVHAASAGTAAPSPMPPTSSRRRGSLQPGGGEDTSPSRGAPTTNGKIKKHQPGDGTAAVYEAECEVCQESNPGKFYRRGFKCQWCAGTASSTRGVPVTKVPELVPSTSNRPGFVKLSSSNEEALAVPMLPRSDAGAVPLGGTPAGGTPTTGNSPGALDSPPPHVMGGMPALLVSGESADAPDITLQQSVRGGGFNLTSRGILEVEHFPRQRYAVSRFAYGAVDPTTGEELPGVASPESTVAPGRTATLRGLYFPTILYTFFMSNDASRQEVTCVTESAKRLDVRGATTGTVRNYEVVMQVAMAALHALNFLRSTAATAHGDLRPYNFFVDSQHNVKVRLAPFAQSARFPAPFCPPEDEEDEGAVQHVNPAEAPYARDMYVLGVTLTFIAYGTAELPTAASLLAAAASSAASSSGVAAAGASAVLSSTDSSNGNGNPEAAMVRFLEAMRRPDPNARCTISEALTDKFPSTVRVVNGIPHESIYCRIDVAGDDLDTIGGGPARSPRGASSGGGYAAAYPSGAQLLQLTQASMLLTTTGGGGGGGGGDRTPRSPRSLGGSFRRSPHFGASNTGGRFSVWGVAVPDEPDMIVRCGAAPRSVDDAVAGAESPMNNPTHHARRGSIPGSGFGAVVDPSSFFTSGSFNSPFAVSGKKDGGRPGTHEPESGAQLLQTFLRSAGPLFQVIRTPGHVTIYSVRLDPRRRPNVSFMLEPPSELTVGNMSLRSASPGPFR